MPEQFSYRDRPILPTSERRRRVGGGFLPTDIDGCMLWLAADSITGLSDGDPVGTWPDQSGNSRDAYQSTASAKPTYKTNIINGLPVVRFDGINDFMTIDHWGTFSDQPFFLFIVASPNSTTQHEALIAKTPIASYDSGFGLTKPTANAGDYRFWINTWDPANNTPAVDFTWTENNFKICGCVFKSTYRDCVVWLNGSETGTPDSSTADRGLSNTEPILLAKGFNPSYMDVDIAEIGIYDSELSDSDRNQLFNYLNDKYAVY